MAGMTDYSHQSIDDIVNDLKDEVTYVKSALSQINNKIKLSKKNGYWNRKVPSHFKNCVAYSLKHYSTVISETENILGDLPLEVKKHHSQRLEKIAKVADEINKEIGIIWHQNYQNKEYGNPDFVNVEEIYGETRDIAANLLDFSSMGARLSDYEGKSRSTTNNPWKSGFFYLFMFVVVIAALAVIAKQVSLLVLPLVIIGGAIIVVIIGSLQLRNDEKLNEPNFLKLIIETLKRLPLLIRDEKK
jgi:hypothetical protein